MMELASLTKLGMAISELLEELYEKENYSITNLSLSEEYPSSKFYSSSNLSRIAAMATFPTSNLFNASMMVTNDSRLNIPRFYSFMLKESSIAISIL